MFNTTFGLILFICYLMDEGEKKKYFFGQQIQTNDNNVL